MDKMGKTDLLLNYLEKQAPNTYVPAKKLAEVVGVSDRTIRSYVRQLNQQTPHLIRSSRSGYQLNTALKHEMVQNHDDMITKRKFYLLRKLLQHTNREINLFDLTEKLHVSDATIRSDLASISRHAKKYNLKLSQSGEIYTLKGSEKSKRTMMTDLIKEQNADGTSFQEDIQKILGAIPIQEISKISQKIFEDNHYHPNTFFFQNFILHLALAIDRRSSNINKETVADSLEKNTKKNTAQIIIDTICEQLHTRYQIELMPQDKRELTALCQSEFQIDSSDYINPEVESILDDALKEIAEIYLLDFSDFQFRQKLLYHVQNLYNRSRQNQISRNFSLMDIKRKYPILFDIAVYLASFLSQRLSIFINEDEISFLALHIGTFIDHTDQQDKKLKTILVMPNYLKINEKTAATLLEHFSSDIVITNTVDNFSQLDLDNKQIDMIITTFHQAELPKNEILPNQIVFIKEFLTQSDLAKIRQTIDIIYQEKYASFLKKQLPILIPPYLFIETEEYLSQESAINLIATKFNDKHIVSPDFETKLLERESLSSTAFPSKIAIPHTIKYEAKQTKMIIIKTKNTISWNGNEGNLIMGLAVKKNDTKFFNRIFPRIIDIVAEECHVNYLNNSKDRSQFIQRLINLMTSDGYYHL